jgi:3-oxoadipate enol-lactonase
VHVERPDGAKIAWFSDGPEDGPVVLLVMGLAYPAAMWFRLLPALTDRYRVVRLDNRGAGETGDVPGPYSVETMTADCLAVLDAAGVEQAHVAGYSMGGLIAQELALTSPGRVRSLLLIATHPGAAHAVWDPDAVAFLSSRGEMTPRQAAEASIPFNYAPGTPADRLEEDWAVRLPLAATPQGYLAQLMGTAAWAGLERLGEVRVPTRVLHGELDRLVPPANGAMIAERIPGAELVVVPGANHLLFTDQPEPSVRGVTEWLARHA